MTGLLVVVCVPSGRHELEVTAQGLAASDSSANVFLDNQQPSPSSMEQALVHVLKQQDIHNAVWSGDGDYRQASFVMCPGEPCEDLLRQLADCGIGSRLQSVVSVMPCSLCIRAAKEEYGSGGVQDTSGSGGGGLDGDKEKSQYGSTAWQRFLSSVRARLTVAQVVEGVRADASLTFDFLTLLLIASLVAALGLIENSSIILVASMLISPLMGPVMAGTFGAVIRDRQLQKMGVMNEVLGLLISLMVGFLYGLVAGSVDQETLPSQEMLDRAEFRALWMNAVVAMASGAAVSISLLGDKTAPFVGVALSASLLPTAVNAGVLWALACMDLVWPAAPAEDPGRPRAAVYSDSRPLDLVIMGAISFCLTLINIVFIFLTGILFLKIKEVTPRASKSQRAFWDHDIKIARDYNKSMHADYQHSIQRLASDLAVLSKGHSARARHRVHSHGEFPQHQELLNLRGAASVLTWSPSTMAELCHEQRTYNTHFRLPGVYFSDYAPLVDDAGGSRHARFLVTPAEDPLKQGPSAY